MSLSHSLTRLVTTLHLQRDALLALGVTANEDMPRNGPHHSLGSLIGDRVDVLRGWLEEGLVHARDAHASLGVSDSEAVRHSLVECNKMCNRLGTEFLSELTNFSVTHDLSNLAVASAGEWSGWAMTVTTEIERCRNLLGEIQDQLLAAWDDLFERTGALSVSVNAKSVGQKTSVRR